MQRSLSVNDLILALLVAVIWGVNFVVAKLGLVYLPPLFAMGLRFLMVAVILLPFKWRLTMPFKNALFIAIVYGVGYHALLFTAIWKGLDIATGIITVQLNVPFTSLLGALLLRDKLGWRRISGMVVAFVGIMVIVGSPDVLNQPVAFLLTLGAAFCWALFNIGLKHLGKIDIFSFLAWVSLLSAPQLLLLSWWLEPAVSWEVIVNPPAEVIFSIFYMAVLSTIVGFGLWSRLLSRYSVHQIAPFSMLMPVFGIVAAIIVLNEPLTWHVVLGGIITLSGVTVIVLRRPKAVVEGAIVS